VPVGATEPVACDLRLVAATHQDLAGQVEGGGFRGDLFARLAELVLETPTLRARREDILPLLAHFLERPVGCLDAELVERLLAHPWPFNVRELVKVAKELSIRGQGQEVLPLSLVEARLSAAAPEPAPPPPSAAAREALEALLVEGEGNISFLARETGWSRRQIKRWLAEHGLDPATYR